MASYHHFLQALSEQQPDRRSVSCLNALTEQNLCRRDALSGDWVIFAPGRNERPAEILEREQCLETHHECPFCAGNEAHTPPATFSICDHSEDNKEWSVRVVPNLFPAVLSADAVREQGVSRTSQATSRTIQDQSVLHRAEFMFPQSPGKTHSNKPTSEGTSGTPSHQEDDSHFGFPPNLASNNSDPLFQSYDLHGGHEVIVETPAHVETLTALSAHHAGRVFEAYAERIRYWASTPEIQYVVVFKNVGAAAGASLRHTHSQLVATSLLPPAIRRNCRRSADHYRRNGHCLLCDLISGEIASGTRIVAQTENFVAFCPFASRLPFLVRIAPREHADRFELESPSRLHEVAALAQRTIASLESLFANCAYNYTVHTRPRLGIRGSQFHWWMEIFPRLTKVAGFEWGSDCFINPITPEMAAQQLRQ